MQPRREEKGKRTQGLLADSELPGQHKEDPS